MFEPEATRATSTAPGHKRGPSRLTAVARAVAILLLAAPIGAALTANKMFFMAFPICLAALGLLTNLLALPFFVRTVVVVLALWPIVANSVFTNAPPSAPFWFLGYSGACVVVFLAFVLLVSRQARREARGVLRNVLEVAPESMESLAARGIPLIATTTTRETKAGIEYTVTWTDFARFRFTDPHGSIFVMAWAAGLAFVLSFLAGDSYRSGHEMALFAGIIFSGAAIILWIRRAHHARARYAARSVVFRPDGSIAINNPPSSNPNRESDGPSLVVENGLRRLVSIEYGRTADWYPLNKAYVHEPGDWFDVFMVFDADHRASVARSVGSRDHAHQIAGQLNVLKARLISMQPKRPRPSRVID